MLTARGPTEMHPKPMLTLYRHHSPIRLTDNSMASSASGCDIAEGTVHIYKHD